MSIFICHDAKGFYAARRRLHAPRLRRRAQGGRRSDAGLRLSLPRRDLRRQRREPDVAGAGAADALSCVRRAVGRAGRRPRARGRRRPCATSRSCYACEVKSSSLSRSSRSPADGERLLEQRLSRQAGRRAAQAPARAPPHRRRPRTIRLGRRRHQAAPGAGARRARLRRRACSACAAATSSPASSIRTARRSRGTSPPRKKDKLEAHLNRFPVVGAIPYLGFFDERTRARGGAAARAGPRRLRARRRRLLDARHHLRSDLLVDARRLRRAHRRGDAARDDPRHRLPARPQRVEREPGHRRRHRRRGAVLRRARRRRRGGRAQRRGAPERAASRRRSRASSSRWCARSSRSTRRRRCRAPTSCVEREQHLRRSAQRSSCTLFPPPPGKKPGVFAAAPLNNAVILSYSVYHRTTPQHRALLAELGGNLRRVRRAVQARRRGQAAIRSSTSLTCARGRSRRRSVCPGASPRR